MSNIKLLLVTYSNIWNQHCQNYETSLKKFGYKKYNKVNYDYYQATYIFIGLGEKWEGFITKIKGYYNFLKSIEEDDKNLIIIVTDAHDVLCVDNYQNTLNTYINNFKDNIIVIGAERWCQQISCLPLIDYWNKNKINNYLPNRFLNSGWFMGKINNLIYMLDYCVYDLFEKKGITDDQLAFCIFAKENINNIELDFQSQFVSTLAGDEYMRLEFREDNNKLKIYNGTTNKFPSFIHAVAHVQDLCYRLDVIGRKIIGEAYVTMDFNDKLTEFSSTWLKNEKQLTIFMVIILLLYYLVNNIKKLKITLSIFLLWIPLLYNYKIYNTNSLDIIDYIHIK